MPSDYGPLSNGETLFSISKALDLPFKTTAQTAAAIWLDNPDQFILGHIHGIKKGTILN
jgi:Tfp pilus assembly protein FimV